MLQPSEPPASRYTIPSFVRIGQVRIVDSFTNFVKGSPQLWVACAGAGLRTGTCTNRVVEPYVQFRDSAFDDINEV